MAACEMNFTLFTRPYDVGGHMQFGHMLLGHVLFGHMLFGHVLLMASDICCLDICYLDICYQDVCYCWPRIYAIWTMTETLGISIVGTLNVSWPF